VRVPSYRAYTTQNIANYYPGYFYARQNRYSIVQGLVDPFAHYLEDMTQKSAARANVLDAIKYASLSIPYIGTVNLGADWEFQQAVTPNKAVKYYPPTVVGNPGTDNISVELLPRNNLEDIKFVVPTGVDLVADNDYVGLLAQGVLSSNDLYINTWLTDGTYNNNDSYLFVEIIDKPIMSAEAPGVPMIKITGRDYVGNIIVDEIKIYKTGVYKTNIKFAYVTTIALYHATNKVNFKLYDYDVASMSYWVVEAFDWYYDSKLRKDYQLFYNKINVDSIDYLVYFYHDNYGDDLALVANDQLITEAGRYEVYDTTGVQVTTIDKIVPYANNRLIVLSGSKIHILDKRDEFTDLFKEYKAFDTKPEGYLYIQAAAQQRAVYDSGTGASTTATVFVDVSKSWQQNSLAGMSLVVNGYEYFIVSNTSTAIEVSSSAPGYVDLSIAVPSSSSYVIKGMPVQMSPQRLHGTMQPQRARIKFKHESGLELIYDGEKFVEYVSDIWVLNNILDVDTDFNFGILNAVLPWSGDYVIDMMIDYKEGFSQTYQTYKSVISIGRRNAVADIDLSSIGSAIVDIYADDGFLRVLTADHKTYICRFIYDYMVVDFTGKEIILLEHYDEVDVS